ncbi:hypothetical protein Dimus_000668 [Dionaea muscipula]
MNEDPKDDTSAEASRDDISTRVFRDVIDMNDENLATGSGMEMVIYRGDPTAQVQAEKGIVHAHIEQAVKCILDGMAGQNKEITTLSEHLESKIFTDNQKERLTNVKLNEIKTYLSNLSDELNSLTIILKKISSASFLKILLEKSQGRSTPRTLQRRSSKPRSDWGEAASADGEDPVGSEEE